MNAVNTAKNIKNCFIWLCYYASINCLSTKDQIFINCSSGTVQRRDDDHSDEEERWQTMGLAEDVLFIVYTERGDDTLLITARKAGPKERRIYYGNSTKYPKGWYPVNP
jgi:uncharacterized DUF497 family protein